MAILGDLAALDDLSQVSVQVIGDVTAMVDGEVKKVGELGGAIIEGLGKTTGGLGKGADEVGKGLGESVGKIGEGLGGLLGGKKKHDDKSNEKSEDDND